MPSRSDWLLLDHAALLRECEVDKYRASGPGGQKRNKTDSAVRLRHLPSGQIVIAEESRSQHENKARALKRMRAALALHLREPINPTAPPPDLITCHRDTEGRLTIPRRHDNYWPVIALLLDAVAAAGGEIRRAADMLGLTTSRLSGVLTDDDKVMAEVNRIRRERGLRPITR